MMRGLKFRVDASTEGLRLDRFLRLAMPALPARSVDFAIATGEVAVGGARAPKGRIVRRGEEVLVRSVPEADDWLPSAADLPGASVLYEDAWVAVLDKPAGAHTEAHRPGETGTLAGYLRHLHPAVAGFARAPGLSLLTRLDFAVSGAVPAALTGESLEFLAREREQGRIRKVYACVVAGHVAAETTISFAIETRGGGRVRVRTGQLEPDPLYWTVVSPVRRGTRGTLVHAAVAKGKRHQVRAHLAAAGFPIAGDALYAAAQPGEDPAGRLMLHAAEVSFVHPGRRERITVGSPLPAGFDVSG